MDFNTQIPADHQISLGLGAHRTWIGKHNGCPVARTEKVSGDHHAVPAVIAMSADYQDITAGLQRVFSQDQIGAARPGGFHQYSGANACFFDGSRILISHLRSRDDVVHDTPFFGWLAFSLISIVVPSLMALSSTRMRPS